MGTVDADLHADVDGKPWHMSMYDEPSRRQSKSVYWAMVRDALLAEGKIVASMSITPDGKPHVCKIYPFRKVR